MNDDLEENGKINHAGYLKVFLCCVPEDQDKVRILHDQLAKTNLDVFYTGKKVYGFSVEDKTNEAFDESHIFIICLSKNSVNINCELQNSIVGTLIKIERIYKKKKIAVIPLLLERLIECESSNEEECIPKRLKRWKELRYFEKDGHKHLVEILRQLAVNFKVDLKKPQTNPSSTQHIVHWKFIFVSFIFTFIIFAIIDGIILTALGKIPVYISNIASGLSIFIGIIVAFTIRDQERVFFHQLWRYILHSKIILFNLMLIAVLTVFFFLPLQFYKVNPTKDITPTKCDNKTLLTLTPTVTFVAISRGKSSVRDNSMWISNSGFTTIYPCEEFYVTFKFLNDGKTEWSDDGGYQLACDTFYHSIISSSLPNNCMGANAVGFAGSNVLPGHSYTFRVTLTGPPLPGFYQSYWDIEHNGVIFGDHEVAVSVQVKAGTP